jgi:hypothetical protein
MIRSTAEIRGMDGDAATLSDNVVSKKLPAWSGHFLLQDMVRLMDNPCPGQLEIWKRNTEDRLGKRLASDLFELLFEEILRVMPELPPLTQEQHDALWNDLVIICRDYSTNWADEFNERLHLKV